MDHERILRVVAEEIAKAKEQDQKPADRGTNRPKDRLFEDGRLAYTQREAAKLLGVCQATVHHLVQAGKLREFKIGAKCYYARRALLNFIRSAESEQLAGKTSDA